MQPFTSVAALPARTQSNRVPVLVNLLLLLFAAALLLTGCKKDPEPEPVKNTLTAVAGPDQQTQVGQTVTLDGSASTDSEGKSFAWSWALIRKPAKSTVVLKDATTAKPSFTADEVGEYEVELTVSNANGKSTDRVLVTAGVAQPTAITGDIRVKTVLNDKFANPELPDYIVTRSIAINSELTIEPGVVIALERDVRLDLNDGGLVIAKGTANQKIRFIGAEKTKGFWVGIAVYSGSNANAFEHVEFLHAGSRTIYSTTKAAMSVGSAKAQVALKNCLFSQNDGYGLYAQDGSILREFSANAFTQNTQSGILLGAANVAKLDAASTFTGGNGRNVVEIMQSALSGTDEVTWGGFADKTPYRVVGYELTLNTGLKLAPGVTVQFARDAVMRVNGTGYLSANGTAAEKITFTGAEKQAGFWQGIITYSTSDRNALEYAELSNAGSKVIVSGKKAALAVYGNKATMSVKSSRIAGSGGYGIYVSYGASVNADAATANTFEANAMSNVQVDK